MPETCIDQGGVRLFDLREQLPFNDNGPHVQLLSENGDARLVGLALRAGQEIKEHHSPSRLTVQAVDGCLVFSVAGQDIHLRAAMVLQIEAGLSHHLRAETDARLLLLMTPSPTHLHTESKS